MELDVTMLRGLRQGTGGVIMEFVFSMSKARTSVESECLGVAQEA